MVAAGVLPGKVPHPELSRVPRDAPLSKKGVVQTASMTGTGTTMWSSRRASSASAGMELSGAPAQQRQAGSEGQHLPAR